MCIREGDTQKEIVRKGQSRFVWLQGSREERIRVGENWPEQVKGGKSGLQQVRSGKNW